MKTPLESGQPGAANWAFFPLYPLITGVISDVTGIASTVVGPLVSTVLFIAAVMVIFRYATLTRNRDNAILAVTIFSFGPYSFYFSCFYTEALFLLLVACSFYYLEKKEWLAAGLCGALLSATRPTGVLIFFPLLVKMITSYDADKKSLPSLARHIFSDEKKYWLCQLFHSGCSLMQLIYIFWLEILLRSKTWRSHGTETFLILLLCCTRV